MRMRLEKLQSGIIVEKILESKNSNDDEEINLIKSPEGNTLSHMSKSSYASKSKFITKINQNDPCLFQIKNSSLKKFSSYINQIYVIKNFYFMLVFFLCVFSRNVSAYKQFGKDKIKIY